MTSASSCRICARSGSQIDSVRLRQDQGACSHHEARSPELIPDLVLPGGGLNSLVDFFFLFIYLFIYFVEKTRSSAGDLWRSEPDRGDGSLPLAPAFFLSGALDPGRDVPTPEPLHPPHPQRLSARGGPEGGTGPAAGPEGEGPERDGAPEPPGEPLQPGLHVRVPAGGPLRGRPGSEPEAHRTDAERDPSPGAGGAVRQEAEGEPEAAQDALGLHAVSGGLRVDRTGLAILAALPEGGQLLQQAVLLGSGGDDVQTGQSDSLDFPEVALPAEKGSAEVRLDPHPVPGRVRVQVLLSELRRTGSGSAELFKNLRGESLSPSSDCCITSGLNFINDGQFFVFCFFIYIIFALLY